MDRYFTIMVIPEREKGVKSFRIPRIIFHAASLIFVVVIFLMIILIYDYSKILHQVYENKHLAIKNKRLTEQIELFQMKINTLTEDIERIHTFEKKLRIITGMENADLTEEIERNIIDDDHKDLNNSHDKIPINSNTSYKKNKKTKSNKNDLLKQSIFRRLSSTSDIKKNVKYNRLKQLYEQKIATEFGQATGYSYTKQWSDMAKQTFALAGDFALFDYKFDQIKDYVKELEVGVNDLDRYLLDKSSFIKSLPTLLPTRGWITSYYGQRKSPYSNRVKMHEGIDIGAKLGTPVLSPADGVVTFSGKKPGFGILVQVDHGYGIETIFAHCSSSTVKRGQKIGRGDMIAKVGNTGYSTGPHVHYEIRVNGTPVDPLYYILD